MGGVREHDTRAHGTIGGWPSGVREHEGALRGRCVRSVDVHGMDRQAGVHAVGTRSERATTGSRSRFSAPPPMKRRDTFQSERACECACE